MPRADPTRSPYCATRHLLRNLDDAAELRRNPLVRACFTPGALRNGADHAPALAHVRGLVHASLAHCRERHDVRMRARIGRMHAALLRCEIDKQPLATVAAALGLSDRQVRRERRAAHDAFLTAFHRTAARPGTAVVHDTATLRIAQTVELHATGQSALATAACRDIASAADPAHRIEACCLAAEIELDGARFAGARAQIAEAESIFARHAGSLGAGGVTLALERIDFAAWSLRHATGCGGGVAMAAPAASHHQDPEGEDDEGRRALVVRALAAYAEQRWEVGDAAGSTRAVERAARILPTLRGDRTKERLAVMFPQAAMRGVRDGHDDRTGLLAIERLAARHGHVRSGLIVRADIVASELFASGGGAGVLSRILAPLDLGGRRAMPFAVAFAACAAAHAETDTRAAVAAARIAEELLPARSALALFARSMRLQAALRERRTEDALRLARALRNDAEALGNERYRGGAERYLAAIAVVQRRWIDAKRHASTALRLLERYGTPFSLAHARRIARRLAID